MSFKHKIGDRVRVVRLESAYGMYEVGDTATVTGMDDDCSGFHAKLDKPRKSHVEDVYLLDNEVVGIGAIKVGTRIRVVDAKTASGRYENGHVGVVTELSSTGGTGYYVQFDHVPKGESDSYLYASEAVVIDESDTPQDSHTTETPMDKDTLRARLVSLKYNDILAVAKLLKPTGLGFDANRKFQAMRAEKGGTMKTHFADWIVDNCPLGQVAEVLDEYKDAAAEARRHGAEDTSADEPDTDRSDAANQLAALLVKLGGKAQMDEGKVSEIALAIAQETAADTLAQARQIISEASLPRPIIVTVKSPDGEKTTDMGIQHRQFDTLLRYCAMKDQRGGRLNVWMTGPAGSGKTTAAENVAKALDLPFYFNGAIDTEYKLLGYTDANGGLVSRPFRKAFEEGGLYLFDEIDASMPGAVLAFNAALANGHCDFPDKCVMRHPDCVIIAAANTFGAGANNEYIGRLKQDGAFLDRFVMLKWEYDEALELALAGNDRWVRKVQKVRKAVTDLGIKHVVSPRASYFGATMLANGEAEADVIDAVIRRGLSDDQWMQVRTKASL